MKIFLLRLKFILQNYTMHLYTEMTAGAVIHWDLLTVMKIIYKVDIMTHWAVLEQQNRLVGLESRQFKTTNTPVTLTTEHDPCEQNPPALWNTTSGFRTSSSVFRCRHSSSSNSATVLPNSSRISSAAAVSRCSTKALRVWTLDMFTEPGRDEQLGQTVSANLRLRQLASFSTLS